MKTVLIGTLFFSGLLWYGLAQEEPETPLPHDQQPPACARHPNPRSPVPAVECKCKKSCDRGAAEDPKCKVYCRKEACSCNHGCETD